jgi:hypothetical protein
MSSEQDEFKSDTIDCSLSFAPKSRCLLSQWNKDWLTSLISQLEAVLHAKTASGKAIVEMRPGLIRKGCKEQVL